MWDTFGGIKKAQKLNFELNPPFCQCDVMCSFLVSLSDEIIRLANLLYATYRKRIV